MSDTPDEPTEPTEVVEPESAADFAPPRPEDAAPRPATADTVTRRGAGLAMAGCLVVGLLLGWGIAAATSDDGGSQPISFQGGERGNGERGPGDFGRGGPEGGFGHGFPGPQGPGGFPGGPGGDFDQRGGGFPGGPPRYDENDEDEGGDDEDSTTTTEQGDT